MDKARVCYILRSHYPKAFGIRRRLQTLKVKRLYNHVLSVDEIVKCEKDPSKKKETIEPYLSKWKKYLSPAVTEMEDILQNGSLYRDREDKDKLREDMLFCRLAYGFIPSEYVSFELEGKSPSERKEYVSDIDMNVFGYSVNDIKVIQGILDKGDSFERFKKYFKRDAVVIEKKDDYKAFHDFVSKHPVFVKKVVFSSMGKGVELVDMNAQEDERTYFDKLIAKGKFLLEECVKQHPEMAKYNDSSVNTVRCFTMKVGSQIEVPWCFMRTGRNGSFVDNGGSGGLVIGIDPESGLVSSAGYDEYNDAYENHPDSGVQFVGCQIPEWNEVIQLCKKAHLETEDMGYLSWDLAYTASGWIVIEVNEVGQFIGPQMTMKKGIKKELLAYQGVMRKYVK